jgi:heat shock protein HslJ
MGGEPVALAGEVAPGETYDIQVNLVAPLRQGIWQAFWQLQNAGTRPFGESLPLAIEVPAAPTPTPAPTQTPAPGISFRVDRTEIKAGECVVFSWQVDAVKAVYFFAEGERWQDSGVPGEGRRQECPPVTTNYYLRVVEPDDSVEVRQIPVYVQPVAGAPIINRFSVEPPHQIPLGSCLDIRWDVGGDVEKVTISSTNYDLWEGAPIRGILSDCPAGPATVAYALEAEGPGGTSRRQETISVVEGASPEPTGEPNLPVIDAFTVRPEQIPAGECVAIFWAAGGGTSMVRLERDGTTVLESPGLDGQQTDCFDEAGEYLYVLEAFDLGGNTTSEQQTVTVTEGTSENPLAGTSWLVTGLYDGEAGEMVAALEGTALTVEFGSSGGLNGSAGCNTYSARYVVDGSALSIGPPRSTSTTCEEPEGIMDQEVSFLSTLNATANFSTEAEQLYLSDASDQVVLELVPRIE